MKISLFLLCLWVLSSCSPTHKLTKDYLYFQNGLDSLATPMREPAIRPNDQLSIYVFSKGLNQAQAAVFNMPNAGNSNGLANEGMPYGYQVDLAGNIEMPIVGAIRASGFTREELQVIIAQKLNFYIKDPMVIIRFSNINIKVLGEVRAPGVHTFPADKITILDAIGAAGDLTDFAKREDILVIREDAGKRRYYRIDLRNGALFQSPAFQLFSHDVVYVAANERKLKVLNVDAEAQRKTSMLFSTVSFIGAIITLIVTLSN